MAGLTKTIVVSKPASDNDALYTTLATFEFTGGSVTSIQLVDGYEARVVTTTTKVTIQGNWTPDLYTDYGITILISLEWLHPTLPINYNPVIADSLSVPLNSVVAACFVLNNGEVTDAEVLNQYRAVVTNTDGSETVSGTKVGETRTIHQAFTRR